MTVLTSLTSEQLAVVNYQGNALLTACPGSGKTRTVAAKIAHAVSIRATASKRWILAITHTNVAAEEIMTRLDRAGIDAEQVWVGTVHSFCLEWILKPYAGCDARLAKGYRIINEFEQRLVEDEIKDQFGISRWSSLPIALSGEFTILGRVSKLEREAVEAYHARLQRDNVIDFSLILTLASFMVQSFGAIGGRLGKLFQLLIIDEYQDLSQIQYDIISRISRHRVTCMLMVGDIDQAIYTTLGAVVKNRLQLEVDLDIEAMKEFNLSGCFRSTQRIIDFYRNFQDYPIPITSRLGVEAQSSSLSYHSDISLSAMAPFVAALIDQHLRAGVVPEEIVVLSAQWPDAAKLGRELQALLPDVRVESPNSGPLPRNLENRWHALIRLRSTPATPENYSRRRRLADRISQDLVQMNFNLTSHSRPRKSILSAANSIPPPNDETIPDYIEHAIYKFCETLGLQLDQMLDAIAELNALKVAAQVRITSLGLEDHAKQLARSFSSEAAIKVTTYHSTKGEEYEVVIATGLLKGKIPHWNDVIDCEIAHTNYVARRLLYVACSRAKHHLCLVSEVGRKTQKGSVLSPTPQLRDAVLTI